MEITLKRTGAATAVAGRYLARPDSRTATICGCGEQGRIQLAALCHVLDIKRVFAWDKDAAAATGFVGAMLKEHGIDVATASNLRAATLESDVIVTCTPSREPYLGLDDCAGHLHRGRWRGQSAKERNSSRADGAGERGHGYPRAMRDHGRSASRPVSAGRMTPEAVHAELGDLVVGRRRGRSGADEITIFDSSGTGIQDVAAAARAFELARDRGVGTRFQLA